MPAQSEKKIIAIVAHFNEADKLDENFLTMLRCIESICDHTILVSTSPVNKKELETYRNILLINRPNIGYDFYSYKVGLSALPSLSCIVDSVLLINSSIFITDAQIFKSTLRKVIDSTKTFDVVGVTESIQINWHLQSYLIALKGITIKSKWFTDFFNIVNPLNSKEAIIMRFEIGFSQKILTNKLKKISLFRPDFTLKMFAQLLWMKRVIALRGLKGLNIIRAISSWNGINWTHFAAKDISERFGIIKKELVVSNPHSISINDIDLKKTLIPKYQKLNDYSQVKKSKLLLSYRKCTYSQVKISGIKIAVLVHIYYIDLLEEIIQKIRNISDPFDLYFTTPFEEDIPTIFELTSKVAASVTICIFPNRGRDIGPFLSLYCDGSLDQYTCVLKLHTKKSKYSSRGDEWRSLLYTKVIGDAIGVRKICAIFENQEVGIVGPFDFYLTDQKFWGANFSNVKSILIETKLIDEKCDPELGFFAGSMFWFSPKALVALKRLKNSTLNFECENGKQDGTLAHAFERTFATISRRSGYAVTSLECDNLQDIGQTNTVSNRVPVL